MQYAYTMHPDYTWKIPITGEIVFTVYSLCNLYEVAILTLSPSNILTVYSKTLLIIC